jgi:hypothetical protein
MLFSTRMSGRPGLSDIVEPRPALPPKMPQAWKRQRSRLRAVMRVLGVKTWNSMCVARPPRQRPAPPVPEARP